MPFFQPSSPRRTTGLFGLPAALALVTSMALSAPASATLIANGGFEDPLNSVTNWDVTAGDVDRVGPGTWAPYEGNVSLDLNGFNAGTIEQMIVTVPGESYLLSFALSGNFSNSSGAKTLNVDIVGTGTSSTAFSFAMPSGWSPTNMGYQIETLGFVADSASTVIRFQSTSFGLVSATPGFASEGAVLDAIQVTAAVPEPAVLGLLALGLAGVGMRRRPRGA